MKTQQWKGEVIEAGAQVRDYERRQMQRFEPNLKLKACAVTPMLCTPSPHTDCHMWVWLTGR